MIHCVFNSIQAGAYIMFIMLHDIEFFLQMYSGDIALVNQYDYIVSWIHSV